MIYTYRDVIFRKRVECRIDSLMIGVMGGLIYFKYNRLIVENCTYIFLAGLIIIIINQILFSLLINSYLTFNMYFCVFYLTVNSLGYICLFPFFIKLKIKNKTICKIVRHFSLLSYSIYLTNHTIVQVLLMPIFLKTIDLSSYIYVISLFLFTAYVCSLILHKIVELPSLYLRDKILPKKI